MRIAHVIQTSQHHTECLIYYLSLTDFILFSSETKHSICFEVVVGLPCFLFPSEDHQWPTLGMQSSSIRRTCPSHLIPSTAFRAICLLVQVFVGNLFQPKHATYLTETPEWSDLLHLHLFPLKYSPALWALQQDWFSIAFIQSWLCCLDSWMLWALVNVLYSDIPAA